MKGFRKYDDMTLDKLKKELIDIFEVFDSLCKKYDIKYFATGGTLLGVVRHGGFIPWDDDLDIGMLRTEYDKFLKYLIVNLRDMDYVHRRLHRAVIIVL